MGQSLEKCLVFEFCRHKDENYSAFSRSIFRANSKSSGISERACCGNSEKGEIIRGMRFARLFSYFLKNTHKHMINLTTGLAITPLGAWTEGQHEIIVDQYSWSKQSN